MNCKSVVLKCLCVSILKSNLLKLLLPKSVSVIDLLLHKSNELPGTVLIANGRWGQMIVMSLNQTHTASLQPAGGALSSKCPISHKVQSVKNRIPLCRVNSYHGPHSIRSVSGRVCLHNNYLTVNSDYGVLSHTEPIHNPRGKLARYTVTSPCRDDIVEMERAEKGRQNPQGIIWDNQHNTLLQIPV